MVSLTFLELLTQIFQFVLITYESIWTIAGGFGEIKKFKMADKTRTSNVIVSTNVLSAL